MRGVNRCCFLFFFFQLRASSRGAFHLAHRVSHGNFAILSRRTAEQLQPKSLRGARGLISLSFAVASDFTDDPERSVLSPELYNAVTTKVSDDDTNLNFCRSPFFPFSFFFLFNNRSHFPCARYHFLAVIPRRMEKFFISSRLEVCRKFADRLKFEQVWITYETIIKVSFPPLIICWTISVTRCIFSTWNCVVALFRTLCMNYHEQMYEFLSTSGEFSLYFARGSMPARIN